MSLYFGSSAFYKILSSLKFRLLPILTLVVLLEEALLKEKKEEVKGMVNY
jgi:hypothetical protein